MKLSKVIKLLQAEFDRVGDVDTYVETKYDKYAATTDEVEEHQIDHVESFRLYQYPDHPVLCCISCKPFEP